MANFYKQSQHLSSFLKNRGDSIYGSVYEYYTAGGVEEDEFILFSAGQCRGGFPFAHAAVV